MANDQAIIADAQMFDEGNLTRIQHEPILLRRIADAASI